MGNGPLRVCPYGQGSPLRQSSATIAVRYHRGRRVSTRERGRLLRRETESRFANVHGRPAFLARTTPTEYDFSHTNERNVGRIYLNQKPDHRPEWKPRAVVTWLI